MIIGSAKPAPVAAGQKVLLVTYAFDYGKPLWWAALGILFGTPARPPDHFDLDIELGVQALDMSKGTLVEVSSLSADENTSQRDRAVKRLFKDLAEDLKGAAPAMLEMLGDAERIIIQVGQVIDGNKGGINDDLRRRIALSQTKASNWKMRQRGAEALSQVMNKEDTGVISNLLDDKQSWVSRALVREVKKGFEGKAPKRGREMVPFFRRAIVSEDSWVRAEITRAVGKAGIPETLPLVQIAAKDKASSVRKAAASALGELGQKEGIETLVPMLYDEEGSTAKASAEALEKLGWKPPDITMKVKDTRLAAVKALSAIGDARAGEAVAKLLKDPNKKVKEAAAKALDAFNWQPDDPEAKVNAFMAAGNEKGIIDMGKEAVGPLQALLADDSVQTRGMPLSCSERSAMMQTRRLSPSAVA
jgi:hypothetical protein